MKSGKQRRLEIKEKRRTKAKNNHNIDVYKTIEDMPKDGVKANQEKLLHNTANWYLPLFYVDKEFTCRDCRSHEIWTAKQQKWWYETAKGHIDSIAVRCRRCRNTVKDKKLEQKAHMKEMAERMPHPNEAFFKKTK